MTNHDIFILPRPIPFIFHYSICHRMDTSVHHARICCYSAEFFSWLQQQKRILVFAVVVMPSHLHAIIKPEDATIAEILQQFGSFTAHEILKKLRADNQIDSLHVFNQNRRDQRHAHSIWQDIQAKNIYSMDFLWQKIEYIHQNPVSKNWKLVKDRADYKYSSAGYYDYGRKPIIEITDVNEWLASTPSPMTAKGA